jgi:hypothetical protein
VELLPCVIAEPMARRFDWYVCSVALALTTMSTFLRVMYGASTTDDEREGRGVLLAVAALLDVAVSVVTFGPMLVDAVELVKHAWSRLRGGDDQSKLVDAGRDVELMLLAGITDDYLMEDMVWRCLSCNLRMRTLAARATIMSRLFSFVSSQSPVSSELVD